MEMGSDRGRRLAPVSLKSSSTNHPAASGSHLRGEIVVKAHTHTVHKSIIKSCPKTRGYNRDDNLICGSNTDLRFLFKETEVQYKRSEKNRRVSNELAKGTDHVIT